MLIEKERTTVVILAVLDFGARGLVATPMLVHDRGRMFMSLSIVIGGEMDMDRWQQQSANKRP